MTTKTQERTTKLDRAGVEWFAENLAEDVATALGIEDGQAVTQALARALSRHDHAIVARFLGARIVEHAVWGDRKYGETDPPTNGALGRAIDSYIEEYVPLARTLQPGIFRGVDELADRAPSGDVIPGADDLRKLVNGED